MISVIIATFNAGSQLEECLRSIRAQAIPDLEIIVVDGGSTDRTLSIIQEGNNGQIRWISEPDKGIYDALNKGAAIARGKWCYFLGSDDRLLPGFREMALQLKDETAIYYGNTEPHYGEGPDMELLSGKFSSYRLAKHCMNHQAIFYPSGIFRRLGYDLRYPVYADYALNIRLWGDRRYKKVYYPFTIARYDMTGFSSVNDDRSFKQDKTRLVREYLGWFIYLRLLFNRLKKKLRGEADFWA